MECRPTRQHHNWSWILMLMMSWDGIMNEKNSLWGCQQTATITNNNNVGEYCRNTQQKESGRRSQTRVLWIVWKKKPTKDECARTACPGNHTEISSLVWSRINPELLQCALQHLLLRLNVETWYFMYYQAHALYNFNLFILIHPNYRIEKFSDSNR